MIVTLNGINPIERRSKHGEYVNEINPVAAFLNAFTQETAKADTEAAKPSAADMGIRTVGFNGISTTVWFTDGRRETVVLTDGDTYNPMLGVLLAYVKHTYGKKALHSLYQLVNACGGNEEAVKNAEAAMKTRKERSAKAAAKKKKMIADRRNLNVKK